MTKIFRKILEWIYPETCIFCGKVCKGGICPKCAGEIVCIEEPCCKKCGKPVRYEEQEYCHDCSVKHFSYEQGRSLWLHKGLVKHSIYQFKYHNRRVYADVYARELVHRYESVIAKWNPDVIIPVPLHKKRRRQRGYNQAEVLAKKLGVSLAIPVRTDLIKRQRYTDPQKKLDKGQRRTNLKDAFAVTGSLENIWSVIIVDDIYTTGSTINAIAEKLKEKGVQKVWFLTISIGQGF